MMKTRSFKTAKGTELPLLSLSGKEYLEVKYRLVWFREEHPAWSIETELMAVTDVSAYARAAIRDEEGRIKATSHKFERIQGFPDFIEKAETGAIGRALALIGFGTQFCADELEARVPAVATKQPEPAPFATLATVVDNIAAKESARTEAPALEGSTSVQRPGVSPGDYLISFGRKYKGRKLKEIPRAEIESYIQWLEASDVRPGTALSHQVEFLKNAYQRMYKNEPVAP